MRRANGVFLEGENIGAHPDITIVAHLEREGKDHTMEVYEIVLSAVGLATGLVMWRLHKPYNEEEWRVILQDNAELKAELRKMEQNAGRPRINMAPGAINNTDHMHPSMYEIYTRDY